MWSTYIFILQQTRRVSVLAKLHQKQAKIAQRSGKAIPQMLLEVENEHNRK